MYAIVDIETTGGSSKKHRMTEIAIIHHDGEKETARYQTLINPEVPIPVRITALTGISDEMVANAPRFHEVAEDIWRWTDGRVFVAHNVSFDYSFVREHFGALGARWRPKRLCTVRLARQLMPGMYSYSLGKLAQQLGHNIEDRHRAMGDCEFTSKLFAMLLKQDMDGHIKYALNARSREATLPPNLPRKALEEVPETMGVYFFTGQQNKVIYIGKANNLKQRVSEHFRGSTHTGFKNRFAEQITGLKWIECPNELIALLTEAREIKKHWPPYNDLMKRVSLNWGVFGYRDQNGYGRFSIGRVGKWDKPLVSFRNQYEARLALERLKRQHLLCARFCDLQEQWGHCAEEVHGPCHHACVGEESAKNYNERYSHAVNELTAGGSMVIRGKGFSGEEQSVVLIEKGRYKGHGLMPKGVQITSMDDVRDFIETGYDDQDIQSIIRSHIFRKAKEDEVILV